MARNWKRASEFKFNLDFIELFRNLNFFISQNLNFSNKQTHFNLSFNLFVQIFWVFVMKKECFWNWINSSIHKKYSRKFLERKEIYIFYLQNKTCKTSLTYLLYHVETQRTINGPLIPYNNKSSQNFQLLPHLTHPSHPFFTLTNNHTL